MSTTVQQWGNSFAVRIPKGIARDLRLRKGSPIVVAPEGDALVIRPARKATPKLATLLKGVTSRNMHKETDWGRPVGKEVW